MDNSKIIDWLLEGDVSIQYQVYRDLLGQVRKDLQDRIATEGWGRQFLSKRKPEGHWGKRFYEPKWISSHYTLLDLRNLCMFPNHPLIKESLQKIVENDKGPDGGINPIGSVQRSDVCVNGMFLNYASYFQVEPAALESVVDFLLNERMEDGGFNCRSNRSGARHSSLHSTLSVIEGFTEYGKNGFTYRIGEVEGARRSSIEFILQHQLFLSDRTGEIINENFLKFPYPPRWKYDLLRALDYLQYAGLPWDPRMKAAVEVLLKKRNKDGTWNQYAQYPGKVHFEMEKAGKPGRWNTLRALRVLKNFQLEDYGRRDLESIASTFHHSFYHKAWHGDEASVRNLTSDEAYAIQDLVTQKRVRSGEVVAGYKVGCTSRAIQAQFGIREPIHGKLFYPHIHQGSLRMDWQAYINCAIEPEMVLKIGKDLRGKDLSDEELIDAIDYISPGIEMHEFHFWVKPPSLQELICTGGIHTGLLIGEQKVSPAALEFGDEVFSVYKDGSLVTSASAKEIMGGPLHSLRWLVNALTEKGSTLERGSIVIPGSPVELIRIDRDTELEIVIDRVGSVKAWFEK